MFNENSTKVLSALQTSKDCLQWIILFVLLYFLFYDFQAPVRAQWEPDIRLTNDAALSNTTPNHTRCITSSGDSVHVVWWDSRDGNDEIYYKNSTDGGTSWGADKRLTNNSAISELPSIAVLGSVVHVVWVDLRDGEDEIYYKRSTDGGNNWESDTALTNDDNVTSWLPSVLVSGSIVHVIWRDLRDGNREIYYKRSADEGISWDSDMRLTNAPLDSFFPSGTVSGPSIHIVWVDERDGNPEIYYKRSTDAGLSWEADIRLTNNSAMSSVPCVSVSGSVVHVVWDDLRDTNWEIYYKPSTDGGISWGADSRLTNNVFSSWDPFVTVSGSVVHVAWYDERDGNYEIYYNRSGNGGVSWGTDTRLTNNSAGSERPSISVSGSVVHLVWFDERDGNPEIYYKRDPTGNLVGITNINSEIPNEFSLSQNYPNPFNPSTNISFDIPKSGDVSLNVYDQLGKEVKTLSFGFKNAGTYEINFDGSELSTGVYFYRLKAAEFSDIKRMILIK